MLGYLHPDNIYDDFKINKLTQQEAINLLSSLREKTNSSYFKVRCIEILDKIGTEISKIVKYASILVNDRFPEVRSRALKIILKDSSKTALFLLESLIPKEDSFFVLISIYKALNTSQERQFKRLQNQIVEKIANFHGVVFEEGKFILDLFMASNSNEFINLHLDKEYQDWCISNHLRDFIPKYVDTDWSPRFIIKNWHIISLDCSFMELTKLPESISLLSRLRYLKLNSNYLKDLPEAISKLCWLKDLDIRSNKFLTLSDVLNILKYIKRFHFECNYKLKYLPNWIIQFSERIFTKKYIKEGVNPKEAPILGLFEILLGYKLEKADLEECVNGEGGCFYKINKKGNVIGIYIHGNYPDCPVLPLIPNQIGELKSLKELSLPYNRKIRKIPESIGKLTSLKYLNLAGNRISDIEKLNSSKNLLHLKKLKLSWNRIKEIKGLEDLLNLEELDLSNNQINEIKGLENLSNLNYLNLEWNPIPEHLIKSLGGLKIIRGQKIIKYPQKLVDYCRKANKT